MKNVMQKCDSNNKNLWLRDGVFYFIMEAPRVNGKRRYIRKSLHTQITLVLYKGQPAYAKATAGKPANGKTIFYSFSD